MKGFWYDNKFAWRANGKKIKEKNSKKNTVKQKR